VGYNNKIKLTTAKYYTPSGRCVQAIDYSNRNEDGSVGNIPDSLIKSFKTSKGRVVFDGGGIAPDVKIEAESYSRPSLSLLYNDILRDYSIIYFRDHLSIESPSKFKLSDEEFEKFVEYAVGREFDHRTASEVDYDRLMATAKKEGLITDLDSGLKQLESKVKLGKSGSIRKNGEEIKALLEEEIVNRYYFQRGRIESIVRNDKQLKEAIGAELIKF
jgi:carboxyl-terminal processing protease